MNTIKYSTLTDAIRAAAAAGVTLCVLGAPGIGKTAAVHRAAQEMGGAAGVTYHVRVVELASVAEVDVRGYLIPQGDKAVFTRPAFWPAEGEEHGILFLDELPQASPEVQKAIASLLLERRIGDYTLPPGWIIVVAGNRVNDGAGAGSFLSHIVNRLCLVEVEPPTIDECVAYLLDKGYGPEVPAFLKVRGGELLNQMPETDNTPYLTPRSAEALARLIQSWSGGVEDFRQSPLAMGMTSGLIGHGPAVEFKAVMEVFGKLPSYGEIIGNPETARVPEEIDHKYAAIMLVASRAKVEHAAQVVKYIQRFEANFALVGIAALVRRDHKFTQCPQFVQWASENQDVVARLAKFIR